MASVSGARRDQGYPIMITITLNDSTERKAFAKTVYELGELGELTVESHTTRESKASAKIFDKLTSVMENI